MDHFNATVKDGKLVSTRRGLQVSRQRFNGTSFVNSCPQTPSTPGTSQLRVSGPSKPQRQRQLNLPEQEVETRQMVFGTGAWDGLSLETTFVMEAPQERKTRRRFTSKEIPSGPSSCSSSRGSSRASSQATPPIECFSQPLPFRGDSYQSEPTHDNSMLASAPVSMPSRPASLPEEDWKLFHRYFEDIPRKIYPYEDILSHNPAKASEFYNMVAGDITSLHSVLMSGFINEAVLNSSDADSKKYAYHVSKICAILNRKLDHGKAVDPVTLCSIATMAANGCYVGRLDHWHMHMRGLQKVLDTRTGSDLSQPWLLAKMNRADLKGAVALAGTPYLPFTRHHPDISVVVPIGARNSASATLLHLLNPLHVCSQVIASLSSLSVLASAVRLARNSSGAISFEPYALTDEWLAVMHSLVACPGPLREEGANPFMGNGSDIKGEESETLSTVKGYMANHRLHPDVPIVPAGPLGVEPALRVAGLLYLKELLPDWPRNLGGYAVLLSLLRSHLEGILDSIQMSKNGAKLRQGSFDERLVDPLLRRENSPRGSKQDGKPIAAIPQHASLKPTVIFLCLVGNSVSLMADKNEGRYAEEDRYPRVIYQQCLRAVLGYDEKDARGGDVLSDEDSAMLRLFDLVDIRGEGRDDHAALKILLMENL